MIILQGIPFDAHSSYQKGPARAPAVIRKTLFSPSTNLFTESGFFLDSALWSDSGNHDIAEFSEIEQVTSSHLKDADKIFTLGGDHSITYPIIKAFHHRYPKLDILQIDAHADLYEEFEGDRYSHACPFARIMEAGLASRLVQVGIRTLTTHQREQAEKFGVEVHEMKDWNLVKLPAFKNPVYISLDMDAFDPAFAPGVSHHEPGGLSTRDVLDIVQGVQGMIVGADIVEYNPNKDHQDMTAYVAAKMMKEIMGRMLHG